MRIEPIGSYPYQPYIYNTNKLDRSSLNKVQPIEKDVLASKTDFSGLTDEQENINPLRRGETPNFGQILDMQMQMSQRNAARVMKPAGEAVRQETPQSVTNMRASRTYQSQMQRAADAYAVNMIA